MILVEAVILAANAVVVWIYTVSTSTLGRIRRFSFLAALALGCALTIGPLGRAALVDFQWHMVQHIGLMMLVAPGIVLGAPGAVLLQRYPQRIPKLLSTPLARFLCRVEVGWTLFVATLFATHFTPVASLANTSTFWHQFVLLWFLGVGIVYYYPVLNGNPLPVKTPHAQRIVSLLTMMVPETMTGFFLYASTHTLHATRPGISAAEALHQQQAAGALMWAAAMAIDTCWIALAVRDWLADEELKADA